MQTVFFRKRDCFSDREEISQKFQSNQITMSILKTNKAILFFLLFSYLFVLYLLSLDNSETFTQYVQREN